MTIYAGATSRLTESRAKALDPRRWTWQPKVDGAYAQLVTDSQGVLRFVRSRTGRVFGPGDVADLIGVETGHRDAVLIGELEAHTEVGIAAREARGYPLIHLYDAARLSGVDCAGLPYADRLAQLHRERSVAESEHVDPWQRVAGGRGRYSHEQKRFAAFVPRDHRRLPIVESRRDFASLWEQHVAGSGGEGLVACRLDAKLGARASKYKVKPLETLSAVVVSRDRTHATLAYRGIRFGCSAQAKWCQGLVPGAVVDFACDGWGARSMPRNPRLVRARWDLDPSVN